MAVRIPFTSYEFKQPTEPLTEAQYETLRHLSEPQFKEQLKMGKREMGRSFRAELYGDLKFFLILLVVGSTLMFLLDFLFRKIDKYGIAETIAVIIGIIIMLSFFSTLYSSMLSSGSNSRLVKDFAKFMLSQRKDVLSSQNYADYLANHKLKKNRQPK